MSLIVVDRHGQVGQHMAQLRLSHSTHRSRRWGAQRPILSEAPDIGFDIAGIRHRGIVHKQVINLETVLKLRDTVS